MTNKQTIDGVSREIIKRALNAVEYLALRADDIGASNMPLAEELRALLDKQVETTGDDVLRWMDEHQATQHQSEPVAWQYRVSAGPATGWSLWHDGKGEEFKKSYQIETRPLYTEQPTPLAAEAAKAFAKGFNTLESGGGKYRINMQFQSREDAWGAFTALAHLKQLNTPQ